MPLYEYECEKCGHRFEVIQKYSDPPIIVCPKCGGEVRKLFSSPAIQFKGSGFYITDYARAGKSEGESGSSDQAQKGEGTAEGKAPVAETKTEAKAEKKDTAKSESKSEKPTASKPASD
jgi:putative FmdB family regulatory protein